LGEGHRVPSEDAGGGPGIPEQGGTGTGPSGPRSQGGDSPQGKDPRSERTVLLVQAVERPTGRSGSDHQPPEDRSPDEPLPVQGVGGGSPERLLGSDRMEYEEMGGGLPNLKGKTGRNPFDPVNREKRIHENPSHFNLIPDFIGSFSMNHVFQRELTK